MKFWVDRLYRFLGMDQLLHKQVEKFDRGRRTDDEILPLHLRLPSFALCLYKKPACGVVIGLFFLIFTTVACQNQPNQIFIEVDDSRQTLTTGVETVRDALTEASITLGSLDRVEPDLYVQLEQGLTIQVIRVKEEVETSRETVPFERQKVVNEALPAGETRIAQLGVNGEDEITIRVVYENGEEINRTEVSRTPVIAPVPEIIVIGPQDTLPSVPIEGTITYISNGNVWLMRDSSGSRRALTTAGNLDRRVFALSPNGRQLLYTTELTNEIELPINEAWLASTTIVGEEPITVGVQGMLHAQWSPVVTQALVVYSTAQRTPNPPGWQANNDLWLLDMSDLLTPPVEILPTNTDGLYPWWGTSFQWSPDGTKLAYARSDQIGIINLSHISNSDSSDENPNDDSTTEAVTTENLITPLVDFVPLTTFGDWVWVPGLSWSPDSKFIVATVHGAPLTGEPEDESQVFDLWLISVDGTFSVPVAEQVGMWANPVWGNSGIVFGQAVEPLRSINSRYFVNVIDKDGSNQYQIFPFQTEPGVQLPELVWSPNDESLLFVYNGNLHLTNKDGGVSKQLSTDGQAGHPRWALLQTGQAGQPLQQITDTFSLTVQQALTVTEITTPTTIVNTPTPVGIRPTATTTPTKQLTATPVVTSPATLEP